MTDSKPLAVVTGASSGIGRELARQFATNGFDVIVAAEDSELAPAVEDLAATGAEIQPVRADLATFSGVERLLEAIAATGREVDAVALNAGVGDGGAFIDVPLADEERLIDLNIGSTVHRAGMEGTPVDSSGKDDPADVARDGFEALMAGKSQVVAGSAKNKVQAAAAKLLPDQARAATHAKMTKPEGE